MSPLVRIQSISTCLAIFAAGCANWTSSPDAAQPLASPRMPPDSVVLEIAFLPVAPDDQSMETAVWSQIDEQHLPRQLRRQLAANGLRGGIIGSQLPAELRRRIEQGKAESTNPVVDPQPADQPNAAAVRRMQCRTGRRGEIVSSAQRDQLAVLMQHDGRIQGQSFAKARCIFAVKTFPQSDGRVRVELTPEIHHGQPRQRWVGQDGMFRLDAGQDRKVFEQFRLEPILAPGQTFALSCTREPKGLGSHFFTHSNQPAAERTLILIRLAQTQLDDLFAPDTDRLPLVTPDE